MSEQKTSKAAALIYGLKKLLPKPFAKSSCKGAKEKKSHNWQRQKIILRLFHVLSIHCAIKIFLFLLSFFILEANRESNIVNSLPFYKIFYDRQLIVLQFAFSSCHIFRFCFLFFFSAFSWWKVKASIGETER